jgi:hypothetical protein
MNLSLASITSLPRLPLRFGMFALVLTFTSIACLATSLPPAITIVSGGGQATPYASAFARPIIVQATNPANRAALPGLQIKFTSGPGIQLSASSLITDANGQASITATGTAAGVFPVTAQIVTSPTATVTSNLTVNQVALTVTPADVQSLVGMIPSTFSYSITGFVNGENAATANITGAPAFSTTSAAASYAATYLIQTSIGTLAARNYSFVPHNGHLTLTGIPICGNLGALAINNMMTGTYAFNMFDQQLGYSGIFTVDGSANIQGQMLYNGASQNNPTQWNFVGNYRVGNGNRGGAVLLQTSAADPAVTQITSFCIAIDNIVNGVITSGRIIGAYNKHSSTAGTFYLADNTATSIASFNGAYILGLQGTRQDINSGSPLPYAQVAAINLDGKGNVTGSTYDVDNLQPAGITPSEQYSYKQPVTGTYTFNPAQGSGVITLNNGTTVTNLAFFAASSQHLIVMTQDAGVSPDGSSSSPVYFGEAQKQSAGPFNAAAFSGNVNFLSQGADTAIAGVGLVTEAGGMAFDGAGSMNNQTNITLVDGVNANLETSTNGTFPYTVDPSTGRFESRNSKTNACNLCGYLVGPNTLIALSPGSGIPLFTTLQATTIAPSNLKLSNLNGAYSAGPISLVSPEAQPFEGIVTFDGKGNFAGAADTNSPVDGQVNNFALSGTYAVVNGAYTLTMAGDSTPDFYLYLNSKDSGILVPYSPLEIATAPLLTFNAVKP